MQFYDSLLYSCKTQYSLINYNLFNADTLSAEVIFDFTAFRDDHVMPGQFDCTRLIFREYSHRIIISLLHIYVSVPISCSVFKSTKIIYM